MLTMTFPTQSRPSAKTSGTFFGLTARTSMSAFFDISAAVSYMLMPYVSHIRMRVFSDGAHATTWSLENTFFWISPPIRASAIFPAPMNPIVMRCRIFSG